MILGEFNTHKDNTHSSYIVIWVHIYTYTSSQTFTTSYDGHTIVNRKEKIVSGTMQTNNNQF